MRFRPNRRLVRDLERQARYQAGLMDAAEAIKTEAERLTDRGIDQRYRHIADFYEVVEEDGEVRVGNRHGLFHLVEYGSRNNPAYAPLRRGVRAAGLRLDEN